MKPFQWTIRAIAGWIVLGAAGAEAGVANGDWKSGDFTDWSVDSSRNPAQESGVASFSFGASEGPGGPLEPCAAQGGQGNCAAFFGTGGPSPVGQGASIFLSQDGGPPPGGTGLLFLEAGVDYAMSADIAAVSRSDAPDPDGGTITVRVRPVGNPDEGTLIAEHAFGPLQPQETRIAHVTGSFVPPISEFHVLEFEFHRGFPHVPQFTPLNFIDNIAFDPAKPPVDAAVPIAGRWPVVGLALVILIAGATASVRRAAPGA